MKHNFLDSTVLLVLLCPCFQCVIASKCCAETDIDLASFYFEAEQAKHRLQACKAHLFAHNFREQSMIVSHYGLGV